MAASIVICVTKNLAATWHQLNNFSGPGQFTSRFHRIFTAFRASRKCAVFFIHKANFPSHLAHPGRVMRPSVHDCHYRASTFHLSDSGHATARDRRTCEETSRAEQEGC